MRIGGLRGAAVILAMTAATLAVANPATADPGAGPTGSTSTATERLVQKVTFAKAAAEPTIDCYAYADNPYSPIQAPGTILFIGRAECTAAMAQIDVAVQLYRGVSLLASGGRIESLTASTSKSLATPCVSGAYVGNADVTFVAPPGYSPPVIRIVKRSAAVPITC